MYGDGGNHSSVQGLAFLRERGDWWGQGEALYSLGKAQYYAGRHAATPIPTAPGRRATVCGHRNLAQRRTANDRGHRMALVQQ
jgi:hypothetical protein